MANWSSEQQVRLAFEKKLLEQEGFGHFSFYDPSDAEKTRICGRYTSTSGTSYELTIKLTKNYPSEMPGLYVTHPEPLRGYRNKKMTSYGNSHKMHTWSKDWKNYTKICYCKSNYWNPTWTLVNILMKGMLWLESFEAHKRTGNEIDFYSLTYD